ncbi:MAG: zinc-ribbon domain-containing protein [Polymorphobacter sp.]|uniref:zinc-ribbon domain-containing protein n=1 Tax=Polymorphobacter sp. TaxID=1909290 RepID=UPI003A8A09BB
MIVICPNCGAQYRLPDTVSVVGKRMRCADCEHRWTIEAPEETPAGAPELPEAAAPEPPLPAVPAAPLPAETPAAESPPVEEAEAPPADAVDEDAPEDGDDEAPARSGRGWLWWLGGLVLLLLGGVAALVAMERLDPARVPVVGGALARLQPGPSKLVIEAEARVTRVPGGALVLEVTGQLRNTGRVAMSVGALKATLGGAAVGGGTSVARRWTIALPVRRLEAGASVDFSSTLTDVPGGATRLRITTS